MKGTNGSHFNKQQQYPLQNEIASWLQNLILQQDDKDMNEKETLMNILQHHFQDCDDVDHKLVEDFANAILSCRIRRVNYHKRKAISEKDQQEPITPPPQPSGRNNNNSTTKKNKGGGPINDTLNSDEPFFSPSSAVSAKSSSSSNNLSSPAVTQRMQFLNEAKKRREQVTTAAYENSTLLNEKYQEMSIQDDSDNPTTNYDKNDNDNSASDLDQKTNETTKKMEQVHISPPPSSRRHQQETEEKKSNHKANESFATCEDAVNNLMKEFDLSDKSSTNTPKEEQTFATKTTTTNDEKRGIHIITDPNHPAYVPMPPSPEAFTPHFGSSSSQSHFPSDEKPQETAGCRHNSTSPIRLNTIIDDDHSSVRSDHDDSEYLFYRRLNVTNDNKENNGVSSTSPFSNKMHEKNTRTSPNLDNQDTNYTSPTTRDEATNDMSMPDLSNLKFDIGKADSSSNNNSKLRKPTRRNQKIHSQSKDHNKQKGDDLQNDSNAEAMFPPQPAPTTPFAPNVPIQPQNNNEQCPSAIPQEEEPTQFRVELKQSVGKSHHGRKNKSTQKKKKPLTSKNHEANYNNQDQVSSDPKLQESRVDEDVIMDVTMEDCSPTLSPVNNASQPPNDKTTSSNNSSTKLTPPRRGWARSSDVHTDEFLAAMMTQGIKFSVGKSGKVMTTITPPRRHSAKSTDNKDSQTSETNNNSNQQTNDTQSSVDDRNVPNASNEGRTEPTIDELLAKASAVINAEMGLPATGVFSNNTEQTFTTGDSKLSSSQSKATATRQSISLSSRGKSRSFTKSSSRSNGPPAPDSNIRTHDKPTNKHNISTTPKNLFSSASSAENVMSPSNHESATNSGSSVLDNMARQLSDAKDAAKRDQIMALRDVGRSLYINAQYKESIAKYTTAITEFNQHFTSTNKEIINGELLATLYGNRAAGLMMVGAYDAASSDCTKALENFREYRQVLSSQEIIESARSNLRPDGGITLVTKLMARKGRSCLKAGKCNSAEDAFDQAIRLGRLGLLAHKRSREAKLQSGDDSIPSEPEQLAEKSLNQTITESTINKSEVFRLKECIKSIKSLGGVNTNPDSATLKRSNLQSLHHLNTASTLAAGDLSLQEERIKCLASMRRWTEVATYCERLACDNVKSDGVYIDDLADIDPFPKIERAVYLKGNTFESDPQNASSRLLNSREVAEAILRLPLSIAKIYMRALRLEERYSEASKASKALSDHMVRQKITGGSYDWLKVECDKFRRTINGKDRGDELYKNGEYKFAAMKYASVLTIDGEGDGSSSANLHKDPWDVITAGGRLHAVLHCNRAACLMALKLFREASKECTAALRIQSQYMKAILRRARCYARMEHFEESIAEYQRWAQLVDDAKKNANANNHFNACPFDLACDISDVEYKRAMEELIDVRTSHKKAQTAAEARSNRQKWAQDNFRRSNSDFHKRESGSNFPTHDSGTQSAYTKQRHHSFEQERSRRWDSFNGSGPKKQGQPGSDRWNKPQQPRSSFNHSNSRQSTSNGRQSLPNKVKKQNCHYSVLGIQKTATNVQVKKAYHKMALKYHPDKNKDASSTELFRQVKQAYEVLSDETNRRKYNAELRMQESMSYYS